MESAKRVARRGVRFCEGNEKERKERNKKKKERERGNKNSKKNFGLLPGCLLLFFSLSLVIFLFCKSTPKREKEALE